MILLITGRKSDNSTIAVLVTAMDDKERFVREWIRAGIEKVHVTDLDNLDDSMVGAVIAGTTYSPDSPAYVNTADYCNAADFPV